MSNSARSAPEPTPLLSVLVAALNEEATLDRLLEQVMSTGIDLEVILVDDGSTDGTWKLMQQWAEDPRIRAFQHDVRQGKGAAFRTALANAQGQYVLAQDADLEYEPADYERLLAPMLSGRATVVYGTRAFSSHTSYSFWYVMGNRFITLAACVLYNRYLSDINTCYKLLPRELAQSLDLTATGFEIDPEITGKVLRLGHRIYEVPINYVARTREEGKKIGLSDGFHYIATLLRYRLWRPPANAARFAPRSSVYAAATADQPRP